MERYVVKNAKGEYASRYMLQHYDIVWCKDIMKAIIYDKKIREDIVEMYGDGAKLVEIEIREKEDKIENGTLIELPCNVGDTMYIPWQWQEQVGIAVVKVKEIHSIAKGCFAFTTTLDSDSRGFIKTYGCEYLFNDIGKFIFFEREQAEQKLKELKEEL